MVEADQWGVAAEIAEAINTPDVDRFQLFEQIIGVENIGVHRFVRASAQSCFLYVNDV